MLISGLWAACSKTGLTKVVSSHKPDMLAFLAVLPFGDFGKTHNPFLLVLNTLNPLITNKGKNM